MVEFFFLYLLVEQGMSSFVDILLALVFIKKILEIEKESSPGRGKEVLIADFQTFQSHDSAIQPKLVLQNYLREEEILPLEIHFVMSLNFLLHN